ncbi:glycosyltransferase [Candidatus Riflebacteria bacterium]
MSAEENEQAWMPSVAIVIPTLGRPILTRTLASLIETGVAERAEILVLGPIQDEEVHKQIQGLLQQQSRVRHESISFESGDLSHKKNKGCRDADTDIVVFIDDDLVVPPGWIDSLLSPFSDPGVGIVCGPSLMPHDLPRMARLSGLALASGAAGFVARRYRRESGGVRDADWPEAIGCNMACRKSVLESIGGFNTAIIPGEDLLAAFDLLKKGSKFIFNPDAYVHHYPRQSVRGFCRQSYRFGLARIRMFRYGVNIQAVTLLPLAWVGILIALTIASSFSLLALYALLGVLALYGAFDVLVGLHIVMNTKRLSDGLVVLIIPVMHICYGMGEWVELIRPGKSVDDKPFGGMV